MNRREKDQIERMPYKYRPLGAWSYFGLNILFAIPIIGQLCLLIMAIGSGNINRRSYARSFFCGLFLTIIIAVVVAVIILVATGAFKNGFNMANIMETLKQFFANIVDKVKGMIPA